MKRMLHFTITAACLAFVASPTYSPAGNFGNPAIVTALEEQALAISNLELQVEEILVAIEDMNAKGIDPAKLLPPGGRTVGGPGVLNKAATDPERGHQIMSAGGLDGLRLCVTAINLGEQRADVIFQGDSVLLLRQGETGMMCGTVSQVGGVVTPLILARNGSGDGTGPVKIAWRVDTYDQL